MLQYCPYCGVIQETKKKRKILLCPLCNTELAEVPLKYLTKDRSQFLSDAAHCAFVNQVVIPGESYNAEFVENRKRIRAELSEIARTVYENSQRLASKLTEREN